MKQSYFRTLLAGTAVLEKALLKPAWIVLHAAWDMLNSLAKVIAGVPAKVATTLSERWEGQAENLGKMLDDKKTAREDEEKNRRLRRAYQGSLWSEENVSANVVTARVRVAIIAGLQVVSFFTTLRGLHGLVGNLNPMLPLILALVIQGGIIYLTSTAASRQATAGRQLLVAIFLAASIVLSYFGLMEGRMPFQEYLTAEFNSYVDVWTEAHTEARKETLRQQEPDAVVDGAYANLDSFLEQAANLCSDEAIAAAQQDVEHYGNMKVATSVEKPVKITYDAEGRPITYGGGTVIIYVPDPAAVPLLAEAKGKLEKLQTWKTQVTDLRDKAAVWTADSVKDAVKDQLDSQVTLSEFVAAETAVEEMRGQVQALAKAMGIPVQFDLNLSELIHKSAQAQVVTQLSVKTSEELVQNWRDEGGVALFTEKEAVELGWAGKMLSSVTANAPSRLREMANEELERSYHSLAQVLRTLDLTEALTELEDAKDACVLEDPFVRAMGALNPGSVNFGRALFALVVAVANDLSALLVGVLLRSSRLDLGRMNAIPPAILRAHKDECLRAVLQPLIIAYLKEHGLEETVGNIATASCQVLAGFLNKLQPCPQLVSVGFCRYSAEELPTEYSSLVNLLAILNFLRYVPKEKMEMLDKSFVTRHPKSKGFLLLTTRGELWLTDLLGNVGQIELYGEV